MIYRLAILIVFTYSCNRKSDSGLVISKDTLSINTGGKVKDKLSDIEIEMIHHGLVDIQSIDSTLLVDLKYSSKDNFLGFDLYGELDRCFLQKDVAEKLKNANSYLKELHPEYVLLIYDGARPRSIQKKMWDTIRTMPVKQGVYVSNPKFGSLHNFGAAVDLTIADKSGNPLDMGTPYDYFGDLAHPEKEKYFLSTGELTSEQVANRLLLRKVMRKGGFFGIQSEWWHFNACTREVAATKYQIIE